MELEIKLVKRLDVKTEREALREVDKLMEVGGNNFGLTAKIISRDGHKKIIAEM